MVYVERRVGNEAANTCSQTMENFERQFKESELYSLGTENALKFFEQKSNIIGAVIQKINLAII